MIVDCTTLAARPILESLKNEQQQKQQQKTSKLKKLKYTQFHSLSFG